MAFKLPPLPRVVGVRPVTAHGEIVDAERGAHAGGRGFLPNGKMHGAAHLLLGVVRRDGLFDQANAHHAFEQTDRKRGFGGDRRFSDGRHGIS